MAAVSVPVPVPVGQAVVDRRRGLDRRSNARSRGNDRRHGPDRRRSRRYRQALALGEFTYTLRPLDASGEHSASIWNASAEGLCLVMEDHDDYRVGCDYLLVERIRGGGQTQRSMTLRCLWLEHDGCLYGGFCGETGRLGP
jgi:hypothetical protein